MVWVMALLILLFSCGKGPSYKKPEDLAIAFWSMAFYNPSECEDFMSQNMAVVFAFKLFAPASKEQAKVFCENLSDYTRLYTKPIKITAQVEVEYEKDKRYLINTLLHHQRGEPTPVKTFVVKIKDRWYVVP